jgi:hypothetical protein
MVLLACRRRRLSPRPIAVSSLIATTGAVWHNSLKVVVSNTQHSTSSSVTTVAERFASRTASYLLKWIDEAEVTLQEHKDAWAPMRAIGSRISALSPM